jgi:hypothetical protein
VAGVIPALTADDDIGLIGQKIDDFTFAFVAPLSAYENGVCHMTTVEIFTE